MKTEFIPLRVHLAVSDQQYSTVDYNSTDELVDEADDQITGYSAQNYAEYFGWQNGVLEATVDGAWPAGCMNVLRQWN